VGVLGHDGRGESQEKTMISSADIVILLKGRASVYDRGDEKVGSLSQIYLDDNTGLFGMSEGFVPLKGSAVRGSDLRVGKETVTEREKVSAEVRKERVDTDDDGHRDR